MNSRVALVLVPLSCLLAAAPRAQTSSVRTETAVGVSAWPSSPSTTRTSVIPANTTIPRTQSNAVFAQHQGCQADAAVEIDPVPLGVKLTELGSATCGTPGGARAATVRETGSPSPEQGFQRARRPSTARPTRRDSATRATPDPT